VADRYKRQLERSASTSSETTVCIK